MRDGLLGLDQPRGDGLAHAVERHFLERRRRVERHDLRRPTAPRAIGAARRAPLRDRRLDVARDDAAVRAGAARRATGRCRFAGEPPRERRDGGAARSRAGP